jgi:DNA-binding response OmpR family regulator
MPGARILLIEDDEVLCDLIKRNLEARQHDVRVGVDARSAVEWLHARAFDLVLLDINLPDQTGWDVLRNAQRDEALPLIKSSDPAEPATLPVVVLSAVRVSPRRLAEFHPLAYLPKPFPMEALLRLAAEAAQRRNEQFNRTVGVQQSPSSEEELHA